MTVTTFLRILFSLIVSSALACAPKLAFAQHGGRGSHGGGGFHGGGSHGSSRGFRGGGGHYGGGSFHRGMSSAPRHVSGGRSSGFAPRPYRNSAYLGDHRAVWNNSRSIHNTAGNNRLGMAPGSGVHFGSLAGARDFSNAGAGRSAVSDFGNGTSRWHSLGGPSGRIVSTARSYGSAVGGWHSFGPHINRVRSAPARNFANAPGQWHAFRNAENAPVVGTAASTTVGSNRPTTLGWASKSWSGQGHSFWGNTPRSTRFFSSSTRGLSNFGNPRYRNSSFGYSSFSDSRIGSNSLFGSSRFGATQQYHWDAATFGQGTSFGGGFSFASDLFSSLLGFGSFGLRGLGVLGSSLGRLPWNGFPWFGLGWLLSPEFGSNAGPGPTCGSPYLYDQWWNWGTSVSPGLCNIQAQRDYDHPQFSNPYSTETSPVNY